MFHRNHLTCLQFDRSNGQGSLSQRSQNRLGEGRLGDPADPYELSVGGVDFEIDLAAEMLAAERAGEQIAVEVKSFIKRSAVSDFHTALGQSINYQIALEEVDPQRKLYLAVPNAIYNSFFQRRFIQLVIRRTQIHLLTYDEREEVIRQWL